MREIKFQSIIKDNTILIPEEYREEILSPVVVSITTQTPNIHKRKKPYTLKDFTMVKTNLEDWKFNRDEANER